MASSSESVYIIIISPCPFHFCCCLLGIQHFSLALWYSSSNNANDSCLPSYTAQHFSHSECYDYFSEFQLTDLFFVWYLMLCHRADKPSHFSLVPEEQAFVVVRSQPAVHITTSHPAIQLARLIKPVVPPTHLVSHPTSCN